MMGPVVCSMKPVVALSPLPCAPPDMHALGFAVLALQVKHAHQIGPDPRLCAAECVPCMPRALGCAHSHTMSRTHANDVLMCTRAEVVVPPGDMALFEEQFGEYTPDRTLVRTTKHQIGPAAFAAKPKRVVPLRGLNYVKLLRRVR